MTLCQIDWNIVVQIITALVTLIVMVSKKFLFNLSENDEKLRMEKQ